MHGVPPGHVREGQASEAPLARNGVLSNKSLTEPQVQPGSIGPFRPQTTLERNLQLYQLVQT